MVKMGFLRCIAGFILGFQTLTTLGDEAFWRSEARFWDREASPRRALRVAGPNLKPGVVAEPYSADDFEVWARVEQEEIPGGEVDDAEVFQRVALESSWAPVGEVIPYESMEAALSTLAEFGLDSTESQRLVLRGGRDRFQRFFLEPLTPEELNAGATQLGGILTAEWQWRSGRFRNHVWLSYRAESVIAGQDESIATALRDAFSEMRQSVLLGQEARVTLGHLDRTRVEARARLQYEQSPIQRHVYGWIGIALQSE